MTSTTALKTFSFTPKRNNRGWTSFTTNSTSVSIVYILQRKRHTDQVSWWKIDQVSWQKIVSLFNTFLPPVKFTPIHNKTRNNSPALPWGWLCNYFFTHYTITTLVNNQHLPHHYKPLSTINTYPSQLELTGDRSDVTEVEVPHLSLLFLKILPLRHSTICLF